MRRVLRIGHRGAAGHAPENTLTAIQKGIALGVDFVEIDVRRTADGVLVALHDETVNRTTNGEGRVDRLLLQNVKTFNAGNGEHIPTLEEVLKLASGGAGLMLELKVKGVAQQTVEAVREAGFSNPVIYASFLHDELTHVRAVDPEASLMVLFGRLPQAPVARVMEYRPSHVGLRHDTATRRLVDAFHHEDLLVFVYTADNPGDIQHALSVGVDGVISNFPDRIAAGG
jgi:glycerophosphoryl diester phosphodiesterase